MMKVDIKQVKEWLLSSLINDHGKLLKTTVSLSLSRREVTQNEFIVPLSSNLKDIYLQDGMGNSMSATHTESVRPIMTMSDIRYVSDLYQHTNTIKMKL